MLEIGTRARNQPAPPWVLHQALTDPHRDPARQWLRLPPDEVKPDVVESDAPHLLVSSSLWTLRPDARVRFVLPPGSRGGGTDLRWTLLVEEPGPDAALTRHLCKRVNQIINAELRHFLGQ